MSYTIEMYFICGDVMGKCFWFIKPFQILEKRGYTAPYHKLSIIYVPGL